jgi:hypothetical protein
LVADVVDLFTDDKYHIRVLHDWRRVSEEQAAPLDASEYEAAIRQGLSRQRRALYRFTLSSLLRYPLDVSTQLVLTTAMNKLSGMRE